MPLNAVNYGGPDESVECAYPGCANRLRRSDFNEPQFCSKEHRDAAAAPLAASRRERFWLRIVAFAIKRANKAGGLHRGMTKYHWTRPAPPDIDIDIDLKGNDVFGI